MAPRIRLDPSVPASPVQVDLPDDVEAAFRAAFAEHDLELVVAALMRHAVDLAAQPASSDSDWHQRFQQVLRQTEVRYGLPDRG